MMASTERDCEPESKEEGVHVWITIADDNVTSDNTCANNDEFSDLEEGELHSPDQHGGTLCDNTHTGVQQRDDSTPDIASADRRSESSHRTDDTVFLFGPDQINHDSADEHRHIRDDQRVSDKSDSIEPRTENGGRPTNKDVHDYSGKHDNIYESEVSDHSSSKSDDRPRNKHHNKSSGKPDDIQESKHNKHGSSKLHNNKSSERNDVSSKSDHRQTGDDSLDSSRNSDERQARKDVYDSACKPAHYKTSNDRDKRTRSDNTSSRKSLMHSSKSSRKSSRHSSKSSRKSSRHSSKSSRKSPRHSSKSSRKLSRHISKASNSRSSKRNHTRTDSPNSDRRIIVDSNCMNKYRDRESHSMLSSYSRTSSETSASIDKRHPSEDRYIPSRTGQHSSFDHNEGFSQLQRQYKYDFHSTHTSRHGRKSRSNRPYHSPPRTSSYQGESNRGSAPYRKLHSSRIERRRETPPDGHSSGARWESSPRHTRYPTPHRVDNKKHKLYETQDSSFVTSDLRHLIERQKQGAPCEDLLGIKRNLSEDDTDQERDRRFSRNKRMRTHDDDSTARPNKGVNDDTRSQDHYISERRKWRHDERSHSREVDVRNRSPDRNDRRQWSKDSRESACSRPDPLPEQYDMVDQRVTPLDDRSPRSSSDYGRYSDGCGATYSRSLQGRDTSHADIHGRDIADNVNQSADYRLEDQSREATQHQLERFEDSQRDFRDVDIFPNVMDMQIHPGSRLQPTKVIGQYDSLDNYLEIQFRLLREDFVGPLREGITEYVQSLREYGQNEKLKDVNIYNNVNVLCPVASESGTCYLLQFDVGSLKRVRWASSKRFIYGSLLCLSEDNFQTICFATVMDRNPKQLEQGRLTVKIEQAVLDINRLCQTVFTMAETRAYFESYRHVLAGLQNFREGDLPFEKHILFCESQVQAPKYLRTNTDTTFDLRPLVDEDYVLHKKPSQPTEIVYPNPRNSFTEASKPAENVDILDMESWPQADLLHLDQSQLMAIQTALTKEFAIIQGPPGTGKTYIGLKIAKALLHNRTKWEVSEHAIWEVQRPMLIVCYTNHALDQFLEGIVKFFQNGVLRVGNRSNSDVLEPLNLKAARQKMRSEKTLPRRMYLSRKKARNTMGSLRKSICRNGARLRYAKTTVLRESFLRNFMERHYHLLLRQVRRKFLTDSAILVWLGVAQLQEGQFNGNKYPVPRQYYHVDSQIDIEEEVDFIESKRRLDDLDEFNLGVECDQSCKPRDKEKEIEHIEASVKRSAVALDIDDASSALRRKGRLTKTNRNTLTWVQEQLQSTDVMTDEEALRINSMFRISKYNRWRLYRLWRKRCCAYYSSDISNDTHLYNAAASQSREILMQEDREIMQSSTVIGMTTSAAARYQTILQEVQPKIIIVEEAAEVLEAHIITSLSKTCEHLILIGDHKQLKPNPNVYKLARDFNLDVSLFERMVNNNLRCDCLELQHRMRPEIASLMYHIYKNYKNHEDCSKYEDVKGVSTNVFFVDHNTNESFDDDMKSHSNKHEATFVVALCKYLLQQGYSSTQITVLALYGGQLSVLKRLMPRSEFEGVRVTSVDNYQGEENDIILLTLVRSNSEGNIGFLKVDNRVCVALSRAKVGLYVIGNFDLLAKRGKTHLWKSLVCDMKEKGQLGDGLTLKCQNHPNNTGIVVKSDKDFEKAPEGGCSMKCDNRLECGHVCERYCHVLDKDHQEYTCMKTCGKLICEKGHGTKCQNKCHESCHKCTVLTDKKMPICSHQQQVPCHVSPEDFSCKWQCQKLLECGHPCKSLCGEAHTTKCTEKVEKTWTCGHTAKVECHQKNNAQCPNICGKLLDCDHSCTRPCGHCVDGWLHLPCTQKCTRILVCEHECAGLCNQCPSCTRQCENRCIHSKCNKRCGELCVPCMELCSWQCEHFKCSKLCSEPCERPRCNEPCKEILDCGHPCIGLCGEPCPKDCRVCDAEKVTEILFGDEDEPNSRFVLLEDCSAKCIIEAKAMDQYMDCVLTDTCEIKLKKCPKCNTTIRKTKRYGTLLNKTLQDIEDVKTNIITNKLKARNMENEIDVSLDEHVPNDLKIVIHKRLSEMQEPKSENALIALKNQIKIMRRLRNMETQIKKQIGDDIDSKKKTLLESVEKIKTWVMAERQVMTSYDIDAAESELLRMEHQTKLQLHTTRLRATNRETTESLGLQIIQTRLILSKKEIYAVAERGIVEECLTELEKVAPLDGLGIYEEERVMILKAMELPAGHWFKCIQGHVYAIGDCGGAMVEARCPECDSQIGGGSHRLRPDNQLAVEMDHAQFPAWSEQANLANYEDMV